MTVSQELLRKDRNTVEMFGFLDTSSYGPGNLGITVYRYNKTVTKKFEFLGVAMIF